ncbi:hypothetical protein M011DRAFT_330556 [Sporormia fimetaria CBS 119925]|uniref:Alpha/beta-hydrolase n=1 Tax=Sporormia fimetaria CBS 119925 TaxID=1340428 RepID=A0A6A6VI89_9PLEO|nr:hypothetical protein M011DRAFT_330556 [Sporormia fimetaria CBS 119925]
MSSHVLRLALVAVPALAVPLSAVLPDPTTSPYATNPTNNTNSPGSGLKWGFCDLWFIPDSVGVDCANFTVPIDWDAPAGSETIDLRLLRLRRKSNSTVKRIGSLFVNPGGPGVSAAGYIADVANGYGSVSSDILERFDLIGLEPRGVNLSPYSQCDNTIYNERVSLFPKTREDYDRLVDKNRRLGESCLNMTSPAGLGNHLDTLSTVKDLEAVRKALGEKLNWLGLSYGSQIGAQYAELFPDNIRLMVLDGMVQHSQSAASNVLIESTAYATALETFFKWASTAEESPLKGQNVEKLWNKVLKKAAKKPIPAPTCYGNCRPDVNDEEILFATQGRLVTANTGRRQGLANALLLASQGDASDFVVTTPSDSPGDGNPLYAGLTIGCQDWAPEAPSFENFQALMRMAETFSPLTRGASQSYMLQASCIGWPSPLANPPKKLKVQTQSPILIVNSVRDPSTSYAWAVGMLEEIQNAVLLTRNGDGHTSYGYPGATTDAIDKFIISGKLPAPGTVLED